MTKEFQLIKIYGIEGVINEINATEDRSKNINIIQQEYVDGKFFKTPNYCAEASSLNASIIEYDGRNVFYDSEKEDINCNVTNITFDI